MLVFGVACTGCFVDWLNCVCVLIVRWLCFVSFLCGFYVDSVYGVVWYCVELVLLWCLTLSFCFCRF